MDKALNYHNLYTTIRTEMTPTPFPLFAYIHICYTFVGLPLSPVFANVITERPTTASLLA